MKKKYVLKQIEWDTDGEEVKLPKSMTVLAESEDEAVNAATDKTGWCIKGAKVTEFKLPPPRQKEDCAMRATIKDGKEKAAAICRLLKKYLSLKESDVEHLVYREDGEVTVAIRIYDRKLTQKDVGFVKDTMTLAGLAEVENVQLPEEDDTAFYSVLKKS